MSHQNVIADALDGAKHSSPSSAVIWRPSVYGVVIKDNKLLVLPQDSKGYVLPGGGVEIDELSEAAVIREVKEETGIDVQIDRFLDIRENFFILDLERKPHEVWHSLCLYYLCTPLSGELSLAGFDEFEQAHLGMAEWIDLADIEAIPAIGSIDFRPIVVAAIKERI